MLAETQVAIVGADMQARGLEDERALSVGASYRLRAGTSLVLAAREIDLVSVPMLPGAVQLPASGQPILLMPDAPTVGGHPGTRPAGSDWPFRPTMSVVRTSGP